MKNLLIDKQMKIDEIVEKVRELTRQYMISNNEIFGLEYDVGYRQPSMKAQLKIVEDLLDRGINIDVINSPVGISELGDDQKPIIIKSWEFMDYDKIDFGENTKTVFLYGWCLSPLVPEREDSGLIRFSTCDEGYRLIEGCKA